MRIKLLPLKRAVRSALFVLLLNVVGLTNAMAQSFTVGDLNYYVNGDGTTVTVTGHVDGTSATGQLAIPETVTYEETVYSITEIGIGAFSYCSGFSGTLTIPTSVTMIGSSAFSGCSGFNGDLVIPGSITYLGSSVFSGCSFDEVYFNAINIINAPNYIGIFQECSGHLNLSEDFVQIPDYLFYSAGFTGTLMIPNSVTSIGNAAFSGCSGFTGNLTIPNSVTSLGSYAFSGCSGFTGSLVIPNSVTSLGSYAFSGCSGFTGDLVIPNSVTEITDGVFNGCTGFDGELIIPSTVTTIGSYAFAYCSGLSGELVLPSILTTIEQGVFSGCSGFTGELVIPNSVTTISNQAFWDCSSITEVQYNVTNCVDLGWSESAFYGCGGTLVIGENVERIPAWIFYNAAFTGDLVIPNAVTSIGNGAFYSCSGFTGDLVIPNSVTEIGIQAFSGCIGFTGNLVIPNSVTTIENYTFESCYGFTGDLVIPNSVTSIGYGAFGYCYGFNGSLNLSTSLESIGEGAFADCNGLTGTLTIPNTVTSIGSNAFSSCSGFTGDLVIPNSVTTIGYAAFSGCTGFDGTLTLPNSLTSIEYAVFSGCNGFTGDLVIPDEVLSIGSAAFANCSGFNGTLTLGNSLTTISGGAFANCSGFTGDLVIPNSVITIGEGYYSGGYAQGAFSDCSGFNGRLVFGNSLETIGSHAFLGCNGFIGDLVIPSSVSTIGYYAFGMYNSPITSIVLYPVVPPYMYGSFAMNSIHIDDPNNSIKMYVPYESLEDYKTVEYWSDYQPIIYPWLQKSVSGYGSSEGGWYFLASPLVENTVPTMVDNMIIETEYDLYQFNQSVPMQEWQNYEANMETFVLGNGHGYLYANKEDVDLMFKGEFNEDETKEINLDYDANAILAGWNLVGNPFPENAYADRSYYVMNDDGTAIEPVAVSLEMAISACTGIMVKAENADEMITFSKVAPETAPCQGVLQISVAQSNMRVNAVQDKAIVSFNAGDRLEKFVFGEDNARISIPQGEKDYAIASVGNESEMPLNFKASKNGQYTISVNADGMDFSYLHLIDNLTGADVDLLAEPSYTFEAKTSDYASRFKLVFSACGDADGDNENFAFINNGNIIVTNADVNAILQIIDMTGRVVVSTDVARNVSTSGMTVGVYVLRLINGDVVKTQKIVVE